MPIESRNKSGFNRPVDIIYNGAASESMPRISCYFACLNLVKEIENKVASGIPVDDVGLITPVELEIYDPEYKGLVYTVTSRLLPNGETPTYEFEYVGEKEVDDVFTPVEEVNVTSFSYTVVVDACSLLGVETYELTGYHDGAGELPTVGDTIYTDPEATTTVGSINGAFFNGIIAEGFVTVDGVSTAFTCR